MKQRARARVNHMDLLSENERQSLLQTTPMGVELSFPYLYDDVGGRRSVITEPGAEATALNLPNE